ncbi:MAG: segregation/condensation protein A [Clostridia bacterium]|jgi:segregation and condensation protein A|nr:segregation/condensation protein A [Clostridia bacterium]
MAYQVKLPVYEGPMDLLLDLIEENEIDIYNIPIAQITQQYLDYINLAGKLDLELTSEFLIMACTLLSIKAKMLLPKPVVETVNEEQEIDPREELVQKLLEYKEYKEKAKLFEELEERQAQYYWREIDDVELLKKFPPSNPIGDVKWEDLVSVFNKVLERAEKRVESLSLNREKVSIKDKIKFIMLKLKEKQSGLSFYQLISDAVSKEEIIVTFLALLELIKRNKIIVRQKGLFQDIYLYLNTIEEGQDHA